MVVQEFVPSEDNVDFGEGEDRRKGIVGGVEDEALDGGALDGGRV